MNKRDSKAKPQARAGALGHGGGGLSLALLDDSQSLTSSPTVVILPQQRANCQVRMVSETEALLTLADDVLERHNAAKARHLANGDYRDYQAAQALAADRRALLQQIGGES